MSDATPRPERKNRFGQLVDYIVGRNTLIGIAALMLLAISGYATWSGMNDFIVGVSRSTVTGRELPGGLSVSNELLVIAIVIALTFLMWLALRETFGTGRRWRERLVTFPLYLFLALWSVGFGYGFWWSLIAGEEATRTSLAGLQEDARDAASTIAARIDAVRVQLDAVVSWSDGQMSREETSGGSCGVSSGAGRGPLYNARKSVRDQIASLRDGVARSWIAPVQADLEQLQKVAAELGGGTFEERQRAFESRAADIRGRARSIASRSNELGASTAAEMQALAAAVSVPPGKPSFSCHDPTLAQRLRQAAEQAAQPAQLKLRAAAFNEGPSGVANAVKNLWANIGAYATSLVGYLASGGKAAGAWTKAGDPITGRDLIALLATLGIDLGLFALTVLNPPMTPPDRHSIPGDLKRRIRQTMDMVISRLPGDNRATNLDWVRRHFIYHNKASYFVIPNLYGCDPADKDECQRGLVMNQLAGILDDLGLVRWPERQWALRLNQNKTPSRVLGIRWPVRWKSELDDLIEEESLGSMTDLTEIRRKRLADLEKRNKDGHAINLDPAKAERIRSAEPIRNHGLFSKAERMLEIAGWSERARADLELFRLVDEEGLTPLLTVLDGEEAAAQA